MVPELKGIKEITLMVCSTTWERIPGVQIRCLVSNVLVVSCHFIHTEILFYKVGVKLLTVVATMYWHHTTLTINGWKGNNSFTGTCIADVPHEPSV